MKNKVAALFLFLLLFSFAPAQKIAQTYFLEKSIQDSIEKYYLDSSDYKFHSSMKPFITGFTKRYSEKNTRLNRFYHQFTEMDIDFPHNRYQFTALPIIDIEIGSEKVNLFIDCLVVCLQDLILIKIFLFNYNIMVV
jgi:hypothetical protein